MVRSEKVEDMSRTARLIGTLALVGVALVATSGLLEQPARFNSTLMTPAACSTR
jgi:hypothetical protein